MNIDHPHILYILCNYLHASGQGKIVNIFEIPNHEIYGDSKADSAAKSVLLYEMVKLRIPHTNLKYFKNLV